MNRAFWLLPLLAAVSCFDLPEFAQPSFIDRPRILAVIAEPPEFVPSRTSAVTLSVMIASATEITDVHWVMCGMSGGGFGGTSNMFGERDGDSGCGADAMDLGSGERLSVSRDTLEKFLSQDVVRNALSSQLPAAALQQIASSVGYAVTVEVQLLADGKRLRALKRVLIRESETPSSNPPPPSYRFGETLLRSQGEAPPYRCVPDQGGLHVDLRQTVKLTPAFEGEIEPWLETYSVLDARGLIGERKEQAFYTWFTDAGELEDNSTRAPTRENTWQAPDSSGCAQIWLILRDGHAGTTACITRVAVGEGSCEP